MTVVPDLLAFGLQRGPGRTCVTEGSRSLTYAETSERASRLAAALRRRGIGRGDRVALLAQNELEYTEVHVGVVRAGAILVPLNWRLSTAELKYMVADVEPSLLIHGPGYAEAAQELGLPTLHLRDDGHGASYEAEIAAAEPAQELPVLQAGDAAQVIYTSGTTGRPKGAVISNHALWSRWNTVVSQLRAGPEHTFVQTLPMFHIAAHTGWSFLYTGGTQVSVRAYEAETVLAAIERHHATHVLLVPTMINELVHHPSTATRDVSSLECILYGASSIAPEVLAAAISTFGCGFAQFYGLSETFGATILMPDDHLPHLLASGGNVSLSSQVRVVDERGEDVPAGERGEIVARGPMLFDGYWNDPDATAEALRGGWMHTGDIGALDDAGYLFVLDRLKDMVVSGGENVYPREVEDVLYAHPAVREAAVIGIPHERWGEAVHAIVVAAPGSAPDEEGLVAHCRERLAGYKVPKSVEVVAEIPKNATGKVDKKLLRASCLTSTQAARRS